MRSVLAFLAVLAASSGGVARASTETEGYRPSIGNQLRPGRVIVTTTSITILKAVEFSRGSARVQPDSLPMIEAVASTMQNFPDMVIEISGFAERGEARPRRLSWRRAAAVKDALVGLGVPVDRVNVQKERGGRSQRTVEFVVVRH